MVSGALRMVEYGSTTIAPKNYIIVVTIPFAKYPTLITWKPFFTR